MALLVIVLGYAGPSLSRFFRGRNLASEAQRFLALARYGQSRAVSEGVPIVLWIDAEQGSYGLKAQTGYAEEDTRAIDCTLDSELRIEVPVFLQTVQTNLWTMAPLLRGGQPLICFLPDGYLSEPSPDSILIHQTRDNETVWIGASENRTRYEIRTNQLFQARR